MTDGVLNIYKPEGWTSQDVCAKLRRRLGIRRIGHTGTLDPMAAGVLPVCTGKATRIIEYYDLDRKTYHARMRLGVVSDTLDIWGETETLHKVRIVPDEKSDARTDFSGECGAKPDVFVEYDLVSDDHIMYVGEADIRRAFSEYTGRITQIPPKYSALKVNGKRAYDLARQGADFELKGREITIYSNEITDIDADAGEISYDVTCSKGTYIRTICDDIGRKLGCGAVMTALTRTRNGCFSIEDAVDITELVELTDEEIGKRIIPMENTLTNLGTVRIDDNRFTAFINGNSSGAGFRVTDEGIFTDKDGHPVYKVFGKDVFLGTAMIKDRQLIPAKVIYR